MTNENAADIHLPVLPEECMNLLEPERGGIFVDATLGMGGHSEMILNSSSDCRVIGFDQDAEALGLAEKRLERFGDRFKAVRANFENIASILDELEIHEVDGVLADLGVSSLQLDKPDRGFSLRHDAPLDMRMDVSGERETAAEFLARSSEEEIANTIYQFGEERASRKIARRIVERRNAGQPIATTLELAELVRRVVRVGPNERTHPATRTFQALRIAVNDELGVLKIFIERAIEVLAPEGVLAIITFHSLEDRIVKQAFQVASGKCQCPPRIPKCVCGATRKVEILTKKPVTAGESEIERNSRARSAKLRACRKVSS